MTEKTKGKRIMDFPISVVCPKKYYQYVPISMCQECEWFVKEKNGNILCRFEEPERGEAQEKNKLNDLTGSEWLFFTKTVLRSDYPMEYRQDLRQEVGASKPPRLMKLIIEFFTKPNQEILDPFVGTGATLIGASISNRKATGIEINPKWVDVYKKVCDSEDITEQEVYVGDCLQIMEDLREDNRNFDAIITDPPYSPALEKTLTKNDYPNWRRRHTRFKEFSSKKGDFRNSKNFKEYYARMKNSMNLMFDLLKENKYAVIMIRDSYQDGEYIPTSFHISKLAKEIGFVFKGVKIWYQTGSPVRPYGYPYSYVPNIVHHNILVFKKEAG